MYIIIASDIDNAVVIDNVIVIGIGIVDTVVTLSPAVSLVRAPQGIGFDLIRCALQSGQDSTPNNLFPLLLRRPTGH